MALILPEEPLWGVGGEGGQSPRKGPGCGLWSCSWLDPRTEQVPLGDGARMAANPWAIKIPALSQAGKLDRHEAIGPECRLPHYSSQADSSQPSLTSLLEEGEGERELFVPECWIAGCTAAFSMPSLTRVAVGLTLGASPCTLRPASLLCRGGMGLGGQSLCVRSG